MPRLKNRNKQVPNGMTFYDAVLRWTSQRGASFQVICDGLRTARMANPGVTAAKNLATDPNAIAEEVDNYIATHCERMGWTDFITGPGGAAVPFQQGQPRPVPNPISQLRNVAVGSEVLIEWIASGAEAVPQEQANGRAEVCAKCPLNKKGDWASLFTVPISNAIRKALGAKREMKLETPSDHELGVCTACDCPMALKVWVPYASFFPKMSQAAKDALNKENPICWIKTEGNF